MARVKCTELAKTITEYAMNIAYDENIDNIDGVVKIMKLVEPRITREVVVQAINEATTYEKRAMAEETKVRNALRNEARSDRRLKNALREYEKAITEQRQIKEGAARTRKEPTEAVKALQEAEGAIKRKYAKSDAVYGEKLAKQIRDLRSKLEAKDLPLPQPKEPPAISKQMEKLQFERDILRRDLRLKIESMKPKTSWEKMWGYAAEPFNFMRAMMSSMELSGYLRQGGIAVGSHPLALGGKSLKKMFQAAMTEKGAYMIEKEIEGRDNFVWYNRGELELTSWESTVRLAKMEEAFMSRLASYVPGIKQSERAYVTGLNYIRATLFDMMAANATKNGQVLTTEEAKGIAYYVNVATGRGQMGKFKGAAPVLSTLFFSPRWFVSRVQFLIGMPLFKAGSNRVRKQIAKEYVRYATSVGVMLVLAGLMGWDLEDDPKSPDFGKARKGPARMDLTAGLGQLITLAVRVGSGEYKSSATGEIKALRGEDKPYGGMSTTGLIGQTLIRYKLAPGPSTILDIISGEDAIGRPIKWYESVGRHSFPMYWQDAKDMMTSELGFEDKAAVILLGFVGESINVYEERESGQGKKKRGRVKRRVRR